MKSFAPLLSVVVLALAAAKVEASPLEARAKSNTYCNAQVAKFQSQKWCNAYIRDNGGDAGYNTQVETSVYAADATATETVETTVVKTATVNESSKTTVTVPTTKSRTVSGTVTVTKVVPAYTVTEPATTEPVYYFKNDPSKYRRLAARVNTPSNLQGCTEEQIVNACQAKYYPDSPYTYTSTVTSTLDPTGTVDVTVTSATQTTDTTTNSIIKTKTIKDVQGTETYTSLKTVTEVSKTNAISTETVVPSPVNFSKGALISYSQISNDDYAAPGVWTGPGPYANVAEGNNYKTMYTVNAAKHLVYRGTQIAYLVPRKSDYYNYGEIKFTSDKTTIKDSSRILTCSVKSSTVDGPTDDPAAVLGCSAKGPGGARYSKITFIQTDNTSRFGLVADSSSNGAVTPAPSGDAPSEVNFYPVKTFIIAADHIDEALNHQDDTDATSDSHFNPMAIDA